MPTGPRTAATSSARTSNGNTAPMLALGASAVAVTVNVTAVAGTLPTLALSVQWSADGTNFGPADPVDAFSSITGTGVVSKSFGVKARWWRVAWVLGGTSPSFTFSLDSIEL